MLMGQVGPRQREHRSLDHRVGQRRLEGAGLSLERFAIEPVEHPVIIGRPRLGKALDRREFARESDVLGKQPARDSPDHSVHPRKGPVPVFGDGTPLGLALDFAPAPAPLARMPVPVAHQHIDEADPQVVAVVEGALRIGAHRVVNLVPVDDLSVAGVSGTVALALVGVEAQETDPSREDRA